MFTKTFPALLALTSALAAPAFAAEDLMTLASVVKVCSDQNSTVESARRGTQDGKPVIFVTCKGVTVAGPLDAASGVALGSLALAVFAITSSDGTTNGTVTN